MSSNRFQCWLGLLGMLGIAAAATLNAQQAPGPGAKADAPSGFNYENGTSLFKAYSIPQIPSEPLTNSPRVYDLIRDGVIMLSLEDALALALQNNLNIALGRFQIPLAEIDLLRAKSGGAVQGVHGGVTSSNPVVPSSGNAGTNFSSGSSGSSDTSNSNSPRMFSGTGQLSSGAGGYNGTSNASAGGYSGSNGPTNTGFVECCDPIAGINYGWNYAQFPLNYTALIGQFVENSHIQTLSAFYGQGFLSGTSYSVSVSGEREKTNALDALFNPSVGTGLAVGVNQHLLRGFGYRANAVYLRIARNDLKIADSTFRQQVIVSVGNVVNAYYALLSARDQVRVAEEAIKNAQQLVDDDQKGVDLGLIAPLDVIQSKSRLATTQQNLVEAQTSYMQQQQVLKMMLIKTADSPLVAARLEPIDPLPEPRPDDIPGIEEALKLAVENRPEIEQSQLGLRNQDYTIQANRNAMLPSLDAFATYESAGLGGIRVLRDQQGNVIGTVPGGVGDSLSSLFGMTHPNYSAGFTLSVPIRNRAQQANAAQALVEQHMMQTSLQMTKNQVTQDVLNAQIAVTQARAQIAAAVQARVYAQQALDGEIQKFKTGTSTTLNVILEQQNLVTAEGNEAKSRATYASALVQYQAATATILDAHHIILDDAKSGHYTRVPNIPGGSRASTP